MSCTITGIVIRKQPYKDHDLYVTLLSKEYGKIVLTAPQSRRNMQLSSTYELFTVIQVVAAQAEPYARIYQADILQQHQAIRKNYAAYQAACECINSANSLIVMNQPIPEIYEHLINYLGIFNQVPAETSAAVLEQIQYRFRQELLAIEGLSAEQSDLTKKEIKEIIYAYTGATDARRAN